MSVVRDLRLLLRGRDFRRLFAVRIGSQFSDGVFQVALASYVLFSPERQTSPTAIAGAFAAVLLPFSVLGPFTGVFIDRWSRRQILAWSNFVRVLLLMVVASVIAAGTVGPVLFFAVVVTLSVNRFLLAALSAALPHVVDEDRLVIANSLTPTSGTAAFMVGLSAGALLRELANVVGTRPNVVVALAAALLYGVAGLLALRMSRGLLGPDYDPAMPTVREHARHVLIGLVDGLRHLRTRKEAAAGLSAIGAHRFFYGMSTVATILLYRSYFNDPADTEAGFTGLATAVLVSGAGFVAAAFITPFVTERITLQQWVLALLVLASVVQVMPGAFYTVPTLLAAAFALGITSQGVKICVDTLVQETVDDAFRGRVFALYDVIFNVAFVAAAAAAAVLLPVDGKSYPVLALISAGYAATAAAYGWTSRHTPRRHAPR
jgi:MFS family permease